MLAVSTPGTAGVFRLVRRKSSYCGDFLRPRTSYIVIIFVALQVTGSLWTRTRPIHACLHRHKVFDSLVVCEDRNVGFISCEYSISFFALPDPLLVLLTIAFMHVTNACVIGRVAAAAPSLTARTAWSQLTTTATASSVHDWNSRAWGQIQPGS